ncbi:hypothetical protein F5880DRAFT_1472165, partial [Lentinula raphanica]
RSSPKRKQMLKEIQVRANVRPLQLLIDMVVRWSSTYLMLCRANTLKPYMGTFIYEMGMAEPNLGKRRKLDALQLNDHEWERLGNFITLLTYADQAQQAFSSEKEPSLYIGIPALEALHRAWSTRSSRMKYSEFHNALEDGINKVQDYYERITDNRAYVISMCM